METLLLEHNVAVAVAVAVDVVHNSVCSVWRNIIIKCCQFCHISATGTRGWCL